jgi:hypothetical protein
MIAQNSKIYISDLTVETLLAHVQPIQEHFQYAHGTTYTHESIAQALTHWIELSIESLAEEASRHVIEADRVIAFNRSGFQVSRLKEQTVEQAELIELPTGSNATSANAA